MIRFLRVFAALATFCAFLSAQQSPDSPQSIQEQMRAMQQQIAQLQARVAQLEAGAVHRDASPLATVLPPQPQAAVTKTAEPVKRRSIVDFHSEFRLYMDSITRPAGGGAPRVSNIRGRYEWHLDLDAQIHPKLSFHGRLSTGNLNNPLTDIQDFGGGVAKHTFLISEAYIDYHPNRYIDLQGGRVDSPFNDKSRFLFDIDTRFNGTSEIFKFPLENKPFGITRVQLIAGQYTFTNPNFPTIDPGTPSTAANATPSQAFLAAGATPGTQPRASQLFQQGFLADQRLSESVTQQAGFDVQIYRNPNQLHLMSTPAGLFLISNSIGVVPSGPAPSLGNATTTPGGAILTAPDYHIAHVTYTLGHRGPQVWNRTIPLSLNLQGARNLGPIRSDRNAFSAILSAGRSNEAGDVRVLYGLYRKEANSMIGELTENDVAIGSNVNMAAHLFRVEYGFGHGVVFANNFIWSSWLRNSDPAAHFFVPLGRAVPGQFRYQGILIFRF
jgi:hypothetical protein